MILYRGEIRPGIKGSYGGAMEERTLLDSWKEIASYLKRSVSTCQRWEEEFGLPVHRLDGTQRARIFAYPDELDRWLADKLNHIDHIEVSQQTAGPKRRHWRTWMLGSVGVMAVIGFAAVSSRSALFRKPLELPPHNPTLVVLSFENATGDERFDSWRTAFPDLVITDLRQSRLINVIPIPIVQRSLEDLKLTDAQKFKANELAKVAANAGANFVVTGNLSRSGEDIIVSSVIQNPKEGKVIELSPTRGRSEQAFFTEADKLAKAIKSAVGLTPRQVGRDIDDDVKRISTPSPQAFELYSRGHRLLASGRYQDSRSALKKAVALDPKFGLAYKFLFYCCLNDDRSEALDLYYRRAVGSSARISEREKLSLQAHLYRRYTSSVLEEGTGSIIDEKRASLLAELGPKDLKTALEVNERLWALYPDDPEYPPGLTALPELYSQLEEWDKAIAVLERLNPRLRKSTVRLLVQCYQAKGLPEKAERVLDDFLSQNSEINPAGFLNHRAQLARDRQRPEEELRYFEEQYSQSPWNRSKNTYHYFSAKGDLFWARDDLAAAEDLYETIVNPKNQDEDVQRLYNLEVTSLSLGKIEQAIDLAKRVMEGAKILQDSQDIERSRHYDLAYLYRLSGRLPQALQEAEEACRDFEKRSIMAVRSLYLRALIMLEMGRRDDFDLKVEEVRRFIEKKERPKFMKIYHLLMGSKELKDKNFVKAIAHFEKTLDLISPGWSVYSDPEPAKYYFSLAEAYELAGDKPRALWMFTEVHQPRLKGSFSGDLYALSFYRVARIYDDFLRTGPYQNADTYRTSAIENYKKFLVLWKDADRIFPEVEEAKNRLASLMPPGSVSR
jgi:tetratricopeptide (TPR) repeat protein